MKVARFVNYHKERVAKIQIHAKYEPRFLFVTGYERFVYGDHGQYVELNEEELVWVNLLTRVQNSVCSLRRSIHDWKVRKT